MTVLTTGTRPAARDLSWMDRGRCAEVDAELFFPEKGHPSMPAKQVCQGCEVRAECLEYALANGVQHGVWGGLTDIERRRLRRERRTP